MIVEAVGLGLSLFGASANKKAAEASMRAQAAADQASRVATANSMIAQVSSQNAQAEQLQRTSEIMETQGKADAMIRKENYNDTAAMQMVMGAASGRVFGEGSLGAIMDKSQSDFMWDQMWATNSEIISQAAIQQDITSIYQAGATSLILGAEQLDVARLASQAGQQNTAAQAQQAFNNTLIQSGTSFAQSYGDTGVKNLLGI